MSTKVVTSLLPHLTNPETATALFPKLQPRSNAPMILAAALHAVPDEVSRAGWEVAATEAKNTVDPDRLEQLSRYPQKGVRRAVAANPACTRDTISYLLTWAHRKNDDETLEALAEHQPAPIVVELLDELDIAGPHRRRVWRGVLKRLPEAGPVSMAARILTAADAVTYTGVADADAVLVRDYGNTGVSRRAWTLEQALAHAGADVLTGSQLQTALEMGCTTAADARVIARSLQATDPSRRAGLSIKRPTVRPEAGDVYAECLTQTSDPRVPRLALAPTKALSPTSYDRLIAWAFDVTPDQPDRPAWTAAAELLRKLTSSRHIDELSDDQLDELIERIAAHPAAFDSDCAVKLFDACSHRLDQDQARIVLDACGTNQPTSWLTDWSGKRLKPRGAAYERLARRIPDPQLARQLLQALEDDDTRTDVALSAIGNAANQRRYVRSEEHASLTDDVIDVLLEEAGAGLFSAILRYDVAAPLVRYLEARVGDGPHTWQVVVSLLEAGWDQSLVELVSTVQALTGSATDDTDEPLTLF